MQLSGVTNCINSGWFAFPFMHPRYKMKKPHYQNDKSMLMSAYMALALTYLLVPLFQTNWNENGRSIESIIKFVRQST